MRKVRLILLGVLCAGLLVCGIGAGVTLAEVSAFSYGGQQLLKSAQVRSQSLTVTLDLPGSTVYLEDLLYSWGSDVRLTTSPPGPCAWTLPTTRRGRNLRSGTTPGRKEIWSGFI